MQAGDRGERRCEAARLARKVGEERALAWYADAIAIAAACAPWLTSSALRVPRVSYNGAGARFALVFFLAGLTSGCVWRLVAGARALRFERPG